MYYYDNNCGKYRVADPDGFCPEPDPTHKKKPDPDTNFVTSFKKPAPTKTLGSSTLPSKKSPQRQRINLDKLYKDLYDRKVYP